MTPFTHVKQSLHFFGTFVRPKSCYFGIPVPATSNVALKMPCVRLRIIELFLIRYTTTTYVHLTMVTY